VTFELQFGDVGPEKVSSIAEMIFEGHNNSRQYLPIFMELVYMELQQTP